MDGQKIIHMFKKELLMELGKIGCIDSEMAFSLVPIGSFSSIRILNGKIYESDIRKIASSVKRSRPFLFKRKYVRN